MTSKAKAMVLIVLTAISFCMIGLSKLCAADEIIVSTPSTVVSTTVASTESTIPTIPTSPTNPTEVDRPLKGIIKPLPPKYFSDEAYSFKSYEDYTAITLKSSPHYKLQNEYASTGPDGIRMVNGRYCIALGSHFTTSIGQYIDVVLANGIVIPCILGDQKANAHTDKNNIAHNLRYPDYSIVEFIVDLKVLDSKVAKSGNISNLHEGWEEFVSEIIVYDQNFFDEVS